MRIASFNVQNLRARSDASGRHFDGARNEVLPLAKLSAEERALDVRDRALTAQMIAAADADVLALQEVFDQRTLDAFDEMLLAPLGVSYPHRICLPGNDGRRHLALMSRAPLEDVESHAALTYGDIDVEPPEGASTTDRVFRRDCLTARCGSLWLYVVHFKAPADAASLAVTLREALAVRWLIKQRFAVPAREEWLIIGDVNVSDVPQGDVLEILTRDFAVDLGVSAPEAERWTYFNAHRASYARPDRFLASPALAAQRPALTIHREGVSRAAAAYAGARFADVGDIRPRASDHAMLALDL